MNLRALVEIIASRPVLYRKDLAIRYGKDERTIDRWHAAGILPPAIYLHHGCATSSVPMWRPIDIERAERKNPKLKKRISI